MCERETGHDLWRLFARIANLTRPLHSPRCDGGLIRRGRDGVARAVPIIVVLIFAFFGPAQAQQGDDANALNAQATKLYGEGKYDQAIPLPNARWQWPKRRSEPDHPDVGTLLNNLALLSYNQGRYADAELLNKRALAIRETAFGPNHPEVGTSLDDLAELYRAQGRYADAEPLYQRPPAISEKALEQSRPMSA